MCIASSSAKNLSPNGTIDRLLLKTVRDAAGLAVAVDNAKVASLAAILNASSVSRKVNYRFRP